MQIKNASMSDVINSLEQNLIVKTEIADRLHASFDKPQLSIFKNTRNYTTISLLVAEECDTLVAEECDQRILTNIILLLFKGIRVCKVNHTIAQPILDS